MVNKVHMVYIILLWLLTKSKHEEVVFSLQGRVQGLQRQLNHELDNHQRTRESLNKSKSDLQHMKEQVKKNSNLNASISVIITNGPVTNCAAHLHTHFLSAILEVKMYMEDLTPEMVESHWAEVHSPLL